MGAGASTPRRAVPSGTLDLEARVDAYLDCLPSRRRRGTRREKVWTNVKLTPFQKPNSRGAAPNLSGQEPEVTESHVTDTRAMSRGQLNQQLTFNTDQEAHVNCNVTLQTALRLDGDLNGTADHFPLEVPEATRRLFPVPPRVYTTYNGGEVLLQPPGRQSSVSVGLARTQHMGVQTTLQVPDDAEVSLRVTKRNSVVSRDFKQWTRITGKVHVNFYDDNNIPLGSYDIPVGALFRKELNFKEQGLVENHLQVAEDHVDFLVEGNMEFQVQQVVDIQATSTQLPGTSTSRIYPSLNNTDQ